MGTDLQTFLYSYCICDGSQTRQYIIGFKAVGGVKVAYADAIDPWRRMKKFVDVVAGKGSILPEISADDLIQKDRVMASELLVQISRKMEQIEAGGSIITLLDITLPGNLVPQ